MMNKNYSNKFIKNLKSNKKKELYLKYGLSIFALVLVLSTIVYFAFSKLTSQDEREVIRTTVAEFTYEPIKKIAFINDVYVSGGFPSKDTGLTLKSVSCTNGATATFDLDSWSLNVTNGVSKTKCSIYFTK